MTDPKTIARGLHRDTGGLLLQCLPCWFTADHLSWSKPGPTGNALSRLSQRGLLERTSDEMKWGRWKYRLTPLGLEVRRECQRILQETPQ